MFNNSNPKRNGELVFYEKIKTNNIIKIYIYIFIIYIYI